MIPHLASSVISTVKTNFIKWETRVIDHENQQISVQNRWRKLKGNELTRLSQRKRYGNTKQCVHFQLTRFLSKPPCGNATEFWTIRFPQHFRIAETPYFTLCDMFRKFVSCCLDAKIYKCMIKCLYDVFIYWFFFTLGQCTVLVKQITTSFFKIIQKALVSHSIQRGP